MINNGYKVEILGFDTTKPIVSQATIDNFNTSAGNKDTFIQLQTGLSSVPAGYTGIYSVADLQNINNDLNGKYILMADVYLSGVDWTPIGNDTNAFNGTFDGNGHTISNLTINSTSYNVGLFGMTDSSSEISNVILKDANVTSTGDYVGGLVGCSRGKITNCIAENVNIQGRESVGGLAGYNRYKTIENSTSTGTVTGFNRVGGFIGYY